MIFLPKSFDGEATLCSIIAFLQEQNGKNVSNGCLIIQ